MAEESQGDERTFEPTAKRRRSFREEGKIALSRDLAGTVQLIGIVAGFLLVGNALLAGLIGSLTWVFDHVGDGGGRTLSFSDVLGASFDAIIVPTATLCGILIVTTLGAYFAQTGLSVNGKLIAFKWEKLNPLTRLGELFGPKKISIRLGLAVAKLGLAALAVTLVLAEAMPTLGVLGLGDLEGTDQTIRAQLLNLLIVIIAVLGGVATLDYIWQRRRIGTQLRMTREEVRKETEEDEGRPQDKQRRRQRHRELSANRIIREVPLADVIVTNPTHFAVALRYRAKEHRAPVVVAKGADEFALQIRAVARRNAVPIVEHRALARALFSAVKVGRPVPPTLFQAVAEVLAKVYRARSGSRPER